MTQPSPAEHCGHHPDHLVSRRLTECVLRPGHSGSHADQTGMRWWLAKQADAPTRHTVDSITSDALDALYEQLEAAQQTELARQLATCDKAFASATLRAARAEGRAQQAEAAIERLTSPEAIRAAAFAISDYALTHLGRDLGTIHIEPMAEAGLRAALDEHQEQTPT